jgi:hypothetical protein
MNTKSISAIVVLAAMVAVIPAFMVPANAQLFNTDNSASQSATQSNDATATGGAGGFAFGGSANGGNADIDQENEATQQAAQSGAFGSSSNTVNNTE